MSDWADDIAEKHERLSRLDKTLFAKELRLARIAGLREAAEMVNTYEAVVLQVQKTASIHENCEMAIDAALTSVHDRILARIAELEKP